MTERILDISEKQVRLSIHNHCLRVEPQQGGPRDFPLAEVGVLVVSNRQVTYTNAVLAELAKAGAAFVPCDSRYMPVGLLLPTEGHHLQAERMALQADAGAPMKKRLWRQLVRAKISAQGALLKRVHGEDRGLPELAKKVRSGDPENVEAQAARRYWGALFGDADFRRNREGEDQNRFLNYGYGVLRATVGRAIVAAGLHPSLGLHHHNRYDAFCLADDLMEPFRPVVDAAVVNLVEALGREHPLDKAAKAKIIGALLGRFPMAHEARTLFDVLTRTTVSLARVYEGSAKSLSLPEL